jgi:hypothetical protein
MALGLLVDGKIDLAMSIVEHCIFEIKYYNKVLNGNRSYVSTERETAEDGILPAGSDASIWLGPSRLFSPTSHCRSSTSSTEATWTGTSNG